MKTTAQSREMRGKTVRLSWTDGPTKGTTHEHVFHRDGTVEWIVVGAQDRSGARAEAERPKYADEEINSSVRLVSYLSAKSGYTLTMVLNFDDGSVAGIASNDKTWMPVHGSFDVVQ